MKKFLKVLLVIILIIAFFALGVYSSDFIYDNVINKIISSDKKDENTVNTTNEVETDVASDEPLNLSEYDKNQLESTYLPIFVAASKENNEVAILNAVVYEYRIQPLGNDGYAKYKDDKTTALYDKEEVDNIVKALLGEKAESVLSKLEVDSANNLYPVGGNDSYIPYVVTIKEVNKLENGNYEAKIDYFEYGESEYLEYMDKYYEDHNVTAENADSNEIYNSYVATKTPVEATVEFKDAASQDVRYELVNVK